MIICHALTVGVQNSITSKHSHTMLANYITISGLFFITSYLPFPMIKMQKLILCHFYGDILWISDIKT